MKNSIFSNLFIALIPFICFSQSIKGVDYISPFHDGLSAIKKENQWAFINTEGTIVVDFRDDLVKTNFEDGSYPIFKNDRCLISEEKEGIMYFGFIDKSGKIVIPPQFLNAYNFNDKTALVIKLTKDTIGFNNILGKTLVDHNYFEVIIDTKGEIIYYLTHEPKHITLSKKFIKQSPKFTTKLLTDYLFAVWTNKEKWEIKKLKDFQ